MALADGAFYYPTTKEYDRPEEYGLRFEDVTLPSTDGVTLHGWFFSAPSAVGTVVHCHGNAGNISAHFGFVSWLPTVGWNVLCFDYRGFGRSTGKPTRRGTVDDAAAAIAYARTREDVDPHRIFLLGQSIGGAIAVVVAARCDHDLAGLCVEGAFASYRSEARFVTRRTWYLWAVSSLISRYLISDLLAPIDYVAALPTIPKLFICGNADPIVDYRQTVELYQAAPDPKDLWLIESSGHTEALTGEIDGGRERVLRFLVDSLHTRRRAKSTTTITSSERHPDIIQTKGADRRPTEPRP